MVWNKNKHFKKRNSILSFQPSKILKKGIGQERYNWKGGISRNYAYRLMRNEEKICAKCNKINCHLDIDHIDGNSKNNSIKNLQLLCISCHHKKHNRIANIPKEKMGINPSYFLNENFEKFRNKETGRFEKWG